MTISELKERLTVEKIPTGWYNLEQTGHKDDTTCLRFSDNKWFVYYTERGKKYEESEFESEAEACEELLTRMLDEKENYK